MSEAKRDEVGVIGQIRAAHEPAADGKVQVHPAFELEGTGAKLSGSAEDAAAAGRVAGVNGALNGGRIDRLAICARSVITYVKDLSHFLSLYEPWINK